MKSTTLKAIGMAVGSTGIGVGGGIDVTGKVITVTGMKVSDLGQATKNHSQDFKNRYLERAEVAKTSEAEKAAEAEATRHQKALEDLEQRAHDINENYHKLMADLQSETEAAQQSLAEAKELEEQLHAEKIAASTPPVPTAEEAGADPGTVPATA